MKKLVVVIISGILIFYNNFTFASTKVISNLEVNDQINDKVSVPSISTILGIPLGIIGDFIQAFFIIFILYQIITIICKILINLKRSFKAQLSNKKLAEIMDRMYEYKRED